MNIVPRDQWFNVNHFFDDFFIHNQLARKSDFFEPRVDIIDKDDHYEFVAELPGVAKEDVNVQFQDGVLTIEAKVNEETSSETDRVIRRERRTGFFRRNINIGENVNTDEIKAEFINGLLKLSAPKQGKEKKEIQKIEIS